MALSARVFLRFFRFVLADGPAVMYLSKLELHGFKSFADRTVMRFDAGITAIVGPNGCGKSNIVDAVRWAIGEQRTRVLRSEKMENVIFSGAANRKPLGLSEVLLTIENNRNILPSRYDEVQLGRRLYRSGDSEYAMNGVTCRLRDIMDLFMDTGMGAGAYSVIELKMIDEILSENTDDRRRLFEEAAGVTKYKMRRRQTLGRLKATRIDLERIRDLTDEIAKQVRSLKRQAGQAERYKKARRRLRALELAIAAAEYTRLAEEQDLLAGETSGLSEETSQATEQETGQAEALTALRENLVACEKRLEAERADLYAHIDKRRETETEQRLAEGRLESARGERQRLHEEQETAALRRIDMTQEIAEVEKALKEAEPAMYEAEKRLAVAERDRDAHRAASEEKQQVLLHLRAEERACEEKHAVQRRQLDKLVGQRDLVQKNMADMDTERREAAAALADLRTRAADTETLTSAAADAVEEARLASERATQEEARIRTCLDEAIDRLHQLKREQEALAASAQVLESMLTSCEDCDGAVQYLAASEWSGGRLTTVADLFACEDADRVALAAALGSFAECIVVRSDREALAAIEQLRQSGQGRATFIVLDRIPDTMASGGAGGQQAVSLAESVRMADRTMDADRCARLVRLLLRNAYVVDTLDEAERQAAHASGSERFFARTGEWVDAQGVLHAGSEAEGDTAVLGRLERRNQLETARSRLQAIRSDIQAAEATIATHRADMAAVSAESLRERFGEAERDLVRAEQKAAQVAFNLEASERRQEALAQKFDEAQAFLEGTDIQTSRLEQDLAESAEDVQGVRSRLAEAETAFQSAEAESRAAAGVCSEAGLEALKARNRCENLQRDLDRARGRLQDMRDRTEARARRIAGLDRKIQEARDRLDAMAADGPALQERQAVLQEAANRSEEALRALRKDTTALEASLQALRDRRERLVQQEHARALRLTEIRTRLDTLVEQVAEDFSVSLPEAVADPSVLTPEDVAEEAAREEARALRERLRSMGSVNELALEHWEEETKRLDFLMQQQQDLEAAEKTLLETIDEINTTASARFMETFQEIRRHFRQTFQDLFGEEAVADLVLEDPAQPLETAIRIQARPGGKTSSKTSLLSGGEKALTAIALLFGIYLVKPSPFCILDEVDAPLDDKNVRRFMRMIRRFAEHTQFLLVTHNKLTMEAADRLYGVTMQEPGVSRIVGVQFDEAVQIVERASRAA